MAQQQDGQGRQLSQQQQELRERLRLDFSLPYERDYNQQRGETKPLQSGFVSSTKWNQRDSYSYRAQNTPSTDGPEQDSKVTCGKDEITKSFYRQMFRRN